MTLRTTYTYAVMEVSQAAYEEIRELLLKAGYTQQIAPNGEIDMHGLALIPGAPRVEEGKPR